MRLPTSSSLLRRATIVRKAAGPGMSPDGKGQFSYAKLEALSEDTGDLSPVDPRIYGTPPEPVPAMAAE